jgi:hypothetical protein
LEGYKEDRAMSEMIPAGALLKLAKITCFGSRSNFNLCLMPGQDHEIKAPSVRVSDDTCNGSEMAGRHRDNTVVRQSSNGESLRAHRKAG